LPRSGRGTPKKDNYAAGALAAARARTFGHSTLYRKLKEFGLEPSESELLPSDTEEPPFQAAG